MIKKKFTPRYVLLSVILLSVCSISCKNMNEKKSEDNLIQRDKDPNARMTDMLGAMEYEYNLIKNPTTGTIPEGVFAAELAQAKQIVETQLINQRPSLANPYAFQGPNNLGGRTRTIAYDVRYDGGANRIILAGGVSGGVYKSIDDGATWVRTSPLGEHFACMSLAQDTRIGFRDTWYYCVGEGSGNSAGMGSGAGYSGNGVYKSTDNGSSWTRLTASNTTALETFTVAQDYITKVIVDPTDGNVYAAAAATIRRSVDGGTTWTTVLSGTLSFSSQFTDIVVSSTGRLYAAFGGTNTSLVDGVWASPPGATSGDAGTWTQIAGAGAGGSPVGWNAEPGYGRIVLAIPPSAETLLYALYFSTASPACAGGATEAELFRWDDVGGTWTDLSATLPNEPGCLAGNDPFACQGGYDLVIAVKPDAASTIFIGGTNAYRSTDAGLTWTRIGGYASPASYALYASSHPDVHSFVFQPGSPLIMLCGNDGGIQRTTDCTAGTVVWTQINSGYRTYQYYHVTLDPRVSNAKVLGGAQDNGSTRNIGGTGTSFESVMGGDGVSVGLSGASDLEYVGFQFGDIIRRSAGSGAGFGTNITPTGESGSGLFVTLFRLDPDNTGNLYYANDEVLYRTTSASTVTPGTWTTMTGIAGVVTPARDITAIATTRGTYSAGTASLFIGASDDPSIGGVPTPKLFRLDDPTGVAAGTVPVDITGAAFPAGGFISSISVNPRNDDTLLVTFSNYGVTSVWWTGTANSAIPTWTAVEGSLTLPSFRSSAIVINGATGLVEYYVGTSVGLYGSTGLPGAIGWSYAPAAGQEGASSIGFAVVSSIALRPVDNRLLIGTHGYGMWATTISSTVPVILTAFKGTLQNNKTALLQWTTSSENNSKHFELEKSIDGISYRKIATMAAAGNSSITRNYNYADREPLTEKSYYRLKSVDLDNDFKVSNVVLLKLSGVKQDMQVLGNPFKNNTLVVRFVKSIDSKGELRLTDMSGRLMARQNVGQGQQVITFNLPSGKLSTGVYLLEAVIGNEKFVTRVLKE